VLRIKGFADKIVAQRRTCQLDGKAEIANIEKVHRLRIERHKDRPGANAAQYGISLPCVALQGKIYTI
jgi:hypothetical protein